MSARPTRTDNTIRRASRWLSEARRPSLAALATTPRARRSRKAISLLEVLISVGVIALGIFGVAALIPVAQFKLEQGITADRQAAAGHRAVAEFRIRKMASPGTRNEPHWVTVSSNKTVAVSNIFDANGNVNHRAYCLDPWGATVSGSNRFPVGVARGDAGVYMQMLRITLTNRLFDSVDQNTVVPIGLPAIQDMFLLPDDMVFQRPEQEERAPRRQFFMHYENPGQPPGVPTKTFAKGSMSWMATITPAVGDRTLMSDQYLLSVVIFKDRIAQPATEEGFAQVTSPFAGEIVLTPRNEPAAGQIRVADLRIGDWLLLAKQQQNAVTGNNVVFHRWTKILGADERDGAHGVPRTFTITTDDFFQPAAGRDIPAHAVFMRGVVAVYQKVIRLENSTLWN